MSKKKFHLKIIESGWGWEIHIVSRNGNRLPIQEPYDFKCQALRVAKRMAADAGWEIRY